MMGLIRDWSVHEDWTTSDHNPISFCVRFPDRAGRTGARETTHGQRFRTTDVDWPRFQEVLWQIRSVRLRDFDPRSRAKVEAATTLIQECIVSACEAILQRKRRHDRSVLWWTRDLTALKKKTYKTRKAFQEDTDPVRRIAKRNEYLLIRRRYTSEIQRARITDWRRFVTKEGNENPWGLLYKARMKKYTPEKALSTRSGDAGHPIT